MTLRRNLLLAMASAFAILAVVLGFGMSALLLGDYKKLERNDCELDANRATSALEQRIDELHTKSSDWSNWDDAYRFVASHDSAFVRSNLTDVTFHTIKLDVVAMTDASRHIVYANRYDRAHERFVPMPEDLLRELQRAGGVADLRRPGSEHSGILMLADGPLMVSVRPLLTSEGRGPVAGSVMFARFLTSQEIEALAIHMHLDVRMRRLDQGVLDPHTQAILSAIESGESVYSEPVEGDHVAAYTVYRDITHRPAMLMTTVQPRSIYLQGVHSLKLLLGGLFLALLVLGGITHLLMERLVLARVASLTAQVQRVGEETAARVELAGHDELTAFAGVVNTMLASVEKSHARLRESELQMRSFFDGADMMRGILALDGDDMLHLFDNVNSERFLRVAPGASRGKHSSELGLPSDLIAHWVRRMRNAVRDQGPALFEFQLEGRGGADHVFSATLCPLPDNGGPLPRFAYVIEEVTDRRMVEEELRRSKDRAESANRAKSDFLATMSHEIRTPMNGVVGMASLLLDTPLTGAQRDYARTIASSAEALLSILNDILDLSKIEAGRFDIEALPFDLESICHDVVELLQPRAAERDLELALRVEPGTPAHLVGDPSRVRQVLLNLVGNALKFTHAGRVRILVSGARVGLTRAEVHVEVQDSGIGIAPAKIALLFQPFTQADGSMSRRYGGTGLGLVICKRLIELMGGTVGCDSVEGQGSTFWFTLQLPVDPAAASPSAPAALAGLRVMLAEDASAQRDALRARLTSWGVRLDAVPDWPAALHKLSAADAAGDPVRVIIADTDLDPQHGINLARSLREGGAHAGTKLLLLGRAPALDTLAGNAAAGADGWLLRPLRHDVIARALAMLCDPACEGRFVTRDGAWSPAQLVMPEPPMPAQVSAIAANAAGPEAAASPPTGPFVGVRILLAEDNPTNQRVAMKLLERLGCEVTVANDGREAIDLYAEGDFVLVFMDCQMPGVDGFDATRGIREIEARTGKRVPICALTANAMEGDRKHCLESGMDDFLAKPVRPAELRAAIERWTRKANGPGDISRAA